MSLDVYLNGKAKKRQCECSECGNKHLATIEDELYWANITHNLGKMADRAGIYYALWRPEKKGWKFAKDIIKPLEKGLKKLTEKQAYFEKLNSSNGWGLYENFVPFVEEYLEACKKYPDAKIEVSR